MKQVAASCCEPTQPADTPVRRQRPLLDQLPDGVLHEVLSYVHWPARATCRAFRAHIDAGRASLDLRWPDCPAQLPALRALLARLPQLQGLTVSGEDCPVDGLTALAVPSLTALSLSDGDYGGCGTITDLSPLTRCTCLVELDLSYCYGLVDISLLAHCSRLTSLVLKGSTITNLIPLATLPALQALSLEDCCHVRDFSPLAKCTALTDLTLSRCDSLANLTPLASCSLLNTLDVGDCDGVRCARQLTACTLLTSLRVGGESLTSITPLAALTSLQHLDITLCRNDAAAGLAPLAGLTALDSLLLGGMSYSDVCPLSACTGLTSLWLNSCPCALDLAPLASCPSLSHVGLSYWTNDDPALPDLHPLSGCPLLSSVHITSYMGYAGHGLSLDLTPLAACTALTRLSLGGHNIAHIAPLAHCPALASLRLWSCAPSLTDLSPLTACVAITMLDLEVTRMDPWRPHFASAAGCRLLQTLDIHTHPHVGDVSILAAAGAFPSLTALALDCRRVLDLGCLTACTNLTSLQLYGGTREVDTSCLAGLTALEVERVECKSRRLQSSSMLDWDVHDGVKGAVGGRKRVESEEVEGEEVLGEGAVDESEEGVGLGLGEVDD